MEIWKDIEEYKGKYQISNMGRVKSLGRYQKNYFGKWHYREGRILKQKEDSSGYKQVTLCKNGKGKNHCVHKLIAIYFIPNKEGKEQVNHIDGNKKRNRYDNLEWCSYHENLKHAMKNGLRAVGERHGFAKLTERNVLKIRSLYKTGQYIYKDLAFMFDVSIATIQGAINGRYWKCIKQINI